MDQITNLKLMVVILEDIIKEARSITHVMKDPRWRKIMMHPPTHNLFELGCRIPCFVASHSVAQYCLISLVPRI